MVEATVEAVDAVPEDAEELASIIKIKVYAVQLETTSSIMVIKGYQTRCIKLGRRLSTMLAPSKGTASETNYRTKQRSPPPILNKLKMYTKNTISSWN